MSVSGTALFAIAAGALDMACAVALWLCHGETPARLFRMIGENLI